jgi:hypothetical protein
MVDYEKLADKAKTIQVVANLALRRQRTLEADPKVFFQKVTAHIGEEMNKANVELRKRGIGTIARNHLPNFEGIIFLASGTESLCRVQLEVRTPASRIIAIISGPPNGNELSRKVYLLGPEGACSEMPDGEEAGMSTVGASPEKVAQDIISGILIGKFE